MGKIYLFTFIFFLTLIDFCGAAQQSPQVPFDIESFITKRNEFMIKEIGLTKSEADAFIPLYNELKRNLFEIGHNCRKYERDLRKKQNLTDAEYLRVVDCNMEVKQKEVALEQEYLEKFKKILSPKKLYKYQRAEYRFARDFIKKNQGGNNSKSKNMTR